MSQNNIKASPFYDQQLEEIELLKNIIPEKIEILKEEPFFSLKIEIIGNTEGDSKKIFRLNLDLNYDYPEQSLKFKFYEINNNLSDRRKNIIDQKLNQCCEENKGFPVIYQLYEICQEFADEEEKYLLINENEKEKENIPYQLNKLSKIKNIKDIPIDIILLKNGNVLFINEQNMIKIYDNKLENILLETLKTETLDYYRFCKYFPSEANKEVDYLYVFDYNSVYIYTIYYLNKKVISDENEDIKIKGNMKLVLIHRLDEIYDVIELPSYKDSIFFINKKETKYLLYEYKKVKKKDKRITITFKDKLIINDSQKVYRKLYYINSEKFIIASYTLKYKEGDKYNIEGINKMNFVNIYNFHLNKSFNIKISPLNNSLVIYKEKYVIVPYFKTSKNDTNLYNFQDNEYNEIFHFKHKHKYNDDYDYYDDYYNYGYESEEDNDYYNSYENKYYSYDILNQFIGVFNIKAEELTTIVENDFVKSIYNINNNILALFEKKLKVRKNEQIATEKVFHHYFNEIPLNEMNSAENYKRENYFSFLAFEEGLKIIQEYFDYSNVTSFIEIDKGYIVIGSKKKGIILYKNN